MPKRVRAGPAIIWLPDWPVRWMLRRHGLPDIPEVRRLLRASWRKGFTFGAAPGNQEMCAIREKALAAVIHALPDDQAPCARPEESAGANPASRG